MMMKKKFTAFILAVSVMCTGALSACKETKTPSEIEVIPEEIVMKELSLDDAEVISVPAIIEREKEAPVELKSVELPDFSELMPEKYSYLNDLNEWNDAIWHVYSCTYLEGLFYLEVAYSSYKSDSNYVTTSYIGHAVFEFDPETGEAKLLFDDLPSYTNGPNANLMSSLYDFDMTAAGGKLYLFYGIYDEEVGETGSVKGSVRIEEFDPTTGEKKEIYVGERDPWLYSCFEDEGRFCMSFLDSEKSTEENSCYSFSRYDSETGQWENLSDEFAATNNIILEYKEGRFNRTIIDEADGKAKGIEHDGVYSIALDENTAKNGSNFTVSDESLMWMFHSYIYYTSDTACFNKYDIENNMRYEVDLSTLGLSSSVYYAFGDGVLLTGSALVHYFIPELGMVFPLTEMGSYNCFEQCGNVFCFTGSEGVGFDEVNSDSEKLYWIELAENEES